MQSHMVLIMLVRVKDTLARRLPKEAGGKMM
jgi:hypothetical protein